MRRDRLARRCVPLLAAAALIAAPALAEKADRDQPTLIDSDRMNADDGRRLSIFEGNVVLRKGTLRVLADRIVVREDVEGFQHATATGKPVRFRQRADPKDGKPAVWIVGEALRIEVDDRNERVELYDSAHVTRDKDEIHGNYILVDQRAESYVVTGGKGKGDGGRVRAVIQPKTQAPDAPSAAPPAVPRAAPPASPPSGTPPAAAPAGTR